jgi:hypothetical protein
VTGGTVISAPQTPSSSSGGTKKTGKKRALSNVKLGRVPRALLVSVRSASSGVVRIYANKGWRRVGYCRTKARAGRTVTCKIKVPKGVNAGKVDVLITLRVDGKLVETLKTNLASAKRSQAHHAHGHHHH